MFAILSLRDRITLPSLPLVETLKLTVARIFFVISLLMSAFSLKIL
jgi:hypothetical protein